jgi:hypothetical protein
MGVIVAFGAKPAARVPQAAICNSILCHLMQPVVVLRSANRTS